MGVNVYAEEVTDRIMILSKEAEGTTLTGIRLYLEDIDSSAITFWGTRDLRPILRQLLAMLDDHYAKEIPE